MFEINPLSDALGAEVVGLDLAQPLDGHTFSKVHQAHLDHQVLVFRDQEITPAQHIGFSRRFGDLSGHVYDQFLLPGHPEILKVSNKKTAYGAFVGLNSAGRRWHSDLSYAEMPSLGSLLYALKSHQRVATRCSTTCTRHTKRFRRRQRTGSTAKAEFLIGSARKYYTEKERPALTEEQLASVPPVEHPVVRTHPETGRKALYVNPAHSVRILGIR